MKILSVDEVKQKFGVVYDTDLQKKLGFKSSGTISKWRSGGIPSNAMMKLWRMLGDDQDEKTDYSLIDQAIIGIVVELDAIQKAEAFKWLVSTFPDKKIKTL